MQDFWKQIIAMIVPLLTDENILKAAKWAVVEVLKRAVEDPAKRAEVIKLARWYVAEVGTFIDELEASNMPSFMATGKK